MDLRLYWKLCILSRIYVRWHINLFKVILFLFGISIISFFKKQCLSKNYKTILKSCPLNCKFWSLKLSKQCWHVYTSWVYLPYACKRTTVKWFFFPLQSTSIVKIRTSKLTHPQWKFSLNLLFSLLSRKIDPHLLRLKNFATKKKINNISQKTGEKVGSQIKMLFYYQFLSLKGTVILKRQHIMAFVKLI